MARTTIKLLVNNWTQLWLMAGTHYPYVLAVRNDRTYGPYVRASFFCARASGPYVRSILTVRKSEFLTPVRDTRTYGP